MKLIHLLVFLSAVAAPSLSSRIGGPGGKASSDAPQHPSSPSSSSSSSTGSAPPAMGKGPDAGTRGGSGRGKNRLQHHGLLLDRETVDKALASAGSTDSTDSLSPQPTSSSSSTANDKPDADAHQKAEANGSSKKGKSRFNRQNRQAMQIGSSSTSAPGSRIEAPSGKGELDGDVDPKSEAPVRQASAKGRDDRHGRVFDPSLLGAKSAPPLSGPEHIPETSIATDLGPLYSRHIDLHCVASDFFIKIFRETRLQDLYGDGGSLSAEIKGISKELEKQESSETVAYAQKIIASMAQIVGKAKMNESPLRAFIHSYLFCHAMKRASSAAVADDLDVFRVILETIKESDTKSSLNEIGADQAQITLGVLMLVVDFLKQHPVYRKVTEGQKPSDQQKALAELWKKIEKSSGKKNSIEELRSSLNEWVKLAASANV